MDAIVKRDTYLNRLIIRKDNGQIKAITGPRRCGKSFILDPIYRNYLLEQGVPEDHIICITFDVEDNETPQELHDREKLKDYLYSRITDKVEPYYVFLGLTCKLPFFKFSPPFFSQTPRLVSKYRGSYDFRIWGS